MQRVDRSEFVHRVAILWLAALALGITWVLLREIVATLLTLFGAVLLVVFLDGCASLVSRWAPIGRRAALTLVLVAGLTATGIFGVAKGPSLVEQTAELTEELPAAWESAQDFFERHAWSQNLLNGNGGGSASRDANGSSKSLGSSIVSRMGGVFSTALGAWTSVAAAIVIALFIAYAPDPYLRATRRLFPPNQRDRALDVLQQVGRGLRWWLVGRIASMFVVGLMTYIGLLILDFPLALTLALLAALFSFVPFLGSILAALPAILIGLADGPSRALIVAAVYTVIQVIEGNAITPFIEERALRLPAGLLVASQLVMGALLGLTGVFLSTPFLVVVVILVQTVYVESALGEDVEVLGSP